MIVAITCTGDRPEALARCFDYMMRQTVQPDKWIVVDDGVEKAEQLVAPCTEMQIIQIERDARPGVMTMARNLDCALGMVDDDDRVVIIEDDDWYAHNYIEHMAHELQQWALVGERDAMYYNVRSRQWWRCDNQAHASLCATAVTGAGVRALRAAVTRARQIGKAWIDLRLWRTAGVPYLLDAGDLCVGIKGMPGRAGFGAGHRPKPGRWTDDPDMRTLRMLVGDSDAEWYAQFGEHAT